MLNIVEIKKWLDYMLKLNVIIKLTFLIGNKRLQKSINIW